MIEAGGANRRSVLLTVLVLAGVAVLLALGTWQVQRLGWKTDQIKQMEARIAAPPIPLPADIDAATVEAREFTQVEITGVFRHEKEMIVLARVRQGKAGSRVITPLETDDGRVVLVDRGWVPTGAEDPRERAAGQIEGLTTVNGLLRARQRTNLFTPENQPELNVWYSIDAAEMAKHAGVSAEPFYVEAGPAENPGSLPIGGRPVLEIPNNHLQYAITWYALAAGLIVVYLVFRRGERRRAAGG